MRITNIQRFSLDDGPGIRTTVFESGCNLHCLWCHNPETQQTIMIDRGGNCSSYEIGLDRLLFEIKKDLEYYKISGGGVTFSGGEPFVQLDETVDILKLCKNEGISTAVESACCFPYEKIAFALEYADLLIADCKAVSNEIHKKCTGVDNVLILETLKKISDSGKKFWIRVPIVPNINATDQEIKKIGEFIRQLHPDKVELLPYHTMGVSKYKQYGLVYKIPDIKPPTETDMLRFREIICKYSGLPLERIA